MPLPYGTADNQRNAIVQALMNVASPPPRTQAPPAPGQYGGATQPPGSSSVMSPSLPGTGQGLPGMPPGGALGLGGNAGTVQPPTGAQPFAGPPAPGQPGPGMSSPFAQGGYKPLAPPTSMPPAPAGPLPYGPMPNVPNLVGQPPPMQSPGSQMPTPTPPLGTY
jgi:hypothetical protein